jgi:hypothetical protein
MSRIVIRSQRLRAPSGPIATARNDSLTCWATRCVGLPRSEPAQTLNCERSQRVHRSALLWLKEWDQCVFKGSAKTSAAAELKRERRKKRARESKFDAAGANGGDEEKVRLL